MPKRNLLLLILLTAMSLLAWAGRREGRAARRVGEVLGAIERSYLRPVDSDDLAAAALAGIVAKLDEHSAIVDGDARRDLEASLDQEFGGVGLELAGSDDGVVVHAPVVGGPAWRAGIAAGDSIVEINGIDVRHLTVRDAVTILRGDVGTTVSLRVRRRSGEHGIDGSEAAEETRAIQIVRELVQSESVLGDRRLSDGGWDWFIEGEPEIGYVRITSFGERTASELDRAVAAMTSAVKPRGLVIDLRGNPGGLVTAAVDVCDRFLEEGVIVSTRRRGGSSGEPRLATTGASLAGVPVVVLIDGLTASAAEIVAACLQDHDRALIVGSRSFGKGTVQSIIPLSDGFRLLKLTTAEYLRPSASATPEREADAPWGVVPDPGLELDLPGRERADLQAWRRHRDALPEKVAGDSSTVSSAATLPRAIDPVLARAIEALPSRQVELRGEKETARDADEPVAAGDATGAGEGSGG